MITLLKLSEIDALCCRSFIAVVGRQGKTASSDRREMAATSTSANGRDDVGHSTDRKVRPAAAAASTAAAVTARSGLHLSNASSTLSLNSSSVGLARLRRSNSIVRVAADKKAKKVLSIHITYRQLIVNAIIASNCVVNRRQRSVERKT